MTKYSAEERLIMSQHSEINCTSLWPALYGTYKIPTKVSLKFEAWIVSNRGFIGTVRFCLKNVQSFGERVILLFKHIQKLL